jgi:hypothetical protein
MLSLVDAIIWADTSYKAKTEKEAVSAAPTWILSSTWDEGHILVLGNDKVGRIREVLDDIVDSFVNEYLAVHPKVDKD